MSKETWCTDKGRAKQEKEEKIFQKIKIEIILGGSKT